MKRKIGHEQPRRTACIVQEKKRYLDSSLNSLLINLQTKMDDGALRRFFSPKCYYSPPSFRNKRLLVISGRPAFNVIAVSEYGLIINA